MLAFSFIFSLIISHYSGLYLVGLLYYFSAIWVGLSVNLLLASVAYFIFLPILNSLKNTKVKTFFGLTLILVAIIYCCYGFYNANQIQIKNIHINLENFPLSWKNKKIVQISDVHMGTINKVDFAQKITDLVNEQLPDLIFITGDYFDGRHMHIDEYIAPLKKLRARQGIYFINGNHEHYFGLEKIRSILEKTQIIYLINDKVEIDGVELIGADYQNSEFSNGIEQALSLHEKDKPSILLYHAPLEIERIKTSGINLMLSGHTHKGQIFPFGLFTGLIFNGYDYGLHQEYGFNQYTSSGVGTWGPPIRTGNKPEIVVITIN